MLDFKNKSIIITGGTGSFGRRFTRKVIEEVPGIKCLAIFSRDEYKQQRMAEEFPQSKYPAIKYILGDIRDFDRLNQVFTGMDYVVHAAALKQVDISEANSMEFVKTNIMGTENVIRAAQQNKVKKVIGLSSDKAVNPVSLYGATKMCSDKLFISANFHPYESCTKFTIVRYGNVIGSRGSVIPLFLRKKKDKKLPITDLEMTRFHVPIGVESNTILFALQHSQGGEIIIPKLSAFRISDVANTICAECAHQTIGLRSGEKKHEELIGAEETAYTYDIGQHYLVVPQNQSFNFNYYKLSSANLKKVSDNFQYSSDNGLYLLSINEIQEEIRKYIDWDNSLFEQRKT
ncbi:SDR family NAD(P)-dependent oxidoreductase [uncultured Microscilla sp.]|uniref:SDR family NAD(P)-dependent oxidoreductase n=1 Tax=uncultured Microscilla sp. TaxID=432653 RepID=UPI0026049A47|nr:SDR family NAD(P)-dependent oxidoreductase [uncultured Microscilla sp.]